MADDEKHIDKAPESAEEKDSTEQDLSGLTSESSENSISPAKDLWVKVYTYKFWIIGLLLFALLAWGLSKCTKGPAQKAIYTIAIDRQWPSLNLGIKNANMTAFCELILQAVAKRENLGLRTRYVNTASAFPMLKSKQFDGVLSSLTPELNYAIKYIYTAPLYHLGPVVIINKDATYTSLIQIKGRSIGLMSQMPYTFIQSQYPQQRFIDYRSTAEAFSDLSTRKIDALIMGALPANIHVKGLYSDFFKILPSYLNDSGIRITLVDNEENQTFVSAFNKGLSALQLDGTYDRLLKEWGLVDTQPQVKNQQATEFE